MGDRLATIDMGRKLAGGYSLSVAGGAGSLSIAMSPTWAEAYLCTKWHLNPSNRLAILHQRYRQTDKQTDRTTVP